MNYQSNRSFTIAKYIASHGLLLLRRAKTTTLHTRVDILFSDVRAMEMRCMSHGLEIAIASPDDMRHFLSKPPETLEDRTVVLPHW